MMEKEFAGVINLAAELVRIDSTNPGAGEGQISDFIYDWFRRKMANYGLTESEDGQNGGRIILHREEVLPGRPMVMLRIQPFPRDNRTADSFDPGKQGAVVLICHQDTVVIGDGWDAETPPFSGLIRDDRMYGRGACDMKAGLAIAMTVMGEQLEQIGRFGQWPKRELVLIASMDEEDFMRGVEYAIDKGWVTQADWVLDLEPTDGYIRVAHKGRTWLEVTVQGKTAHASHPWKGCDAIAAISELISNFRSRILDTPEHKELGHSTVTFGQITGGYRPYVVPDHAQVWIDLRLVPPITTEAALQLLRDAADRAKRAVPGAEISWRLTGNRPFIEKNSSSPLLASLRRAGEAALGHSIQTAVFNGYTDTAVIAGKLHNDNCMSYGPGSLDLAHKPNEFVPLADIRRCLQVYRQLFTAFY
ncbi:MAG: M20 family metallopeptidase [Lachnospiraceae bacterium]|nr:M20 family metallopeptidase [Lachnospiraceae bacterium]MDY5742149.1 M20 family metallopeptidase [Lachnospiraceae bacterium]